jgi:hypothetical protein
MRITLWSALARTAAAVAAQPRDAEAAAPDERRGSEPAPAAAVRR